MLYFPQVYPDTQSYMLMFTKIHRIYFQEGLSRTEIAEGFLMHVVFPGTVSYFALQTLRFASIGKLKTFFLGSSKGKEESGNGMDFKFGES